MQYCTLSKINVTVSFLFSLDQESDVPSTVSSHRVTDSLPPYLTLPNIREDRLHKQQLVPRV